MRHLLLPASLLLLGACDPTFSMEGNIKSPTGPLAKAQATLLCPETEPVHLEADAAGRIEFQRLYTADMNCQVIVSRPGYRTRKLPLARVCVSRFGVGCWSAKLDVVLAARRRLEFPINDN